MKLSARLEQLSLCHVLTFEVRSRAASVDAVVASIGEAVVKTTRARAKAGMVVMVYILVVV